jgi:hypothetical protein
LVSFFLRAGVAVTQGGSQADALMPRWRGSIIVHKATRIFTMPPIPAENFCHLIKRHPGEPNLGNGTGKFWLWFRIALPSTPNTRRPHSFNK